MRIAFFLLCATMGTNAAANSCSQYTQSVINLIEDAQYFYKSEQFQEYGYSAKGPAKGWIQASRETRDVEQSSKAAFLEEYGFYPDDVFVVVEAYRSGSVDDYILTLEADMLDLPPCQ